MLTNPGFEQGSGEVQIIGWTLFNNAYRKQIAFAHGGDYALVAWGNWWPSNQWNASGAYQDYHQVSSGQIWEASGWLYASSNIQGQAYAAINLEFYTAESGLLYRGSSAIRLRNGSPTGQWIHATVRGKIKAGVAFARVVPVFVQSPDFEQGFAYFDDCALYLVPTTRMSWAGYEWEVVEEYADPGPNYFSTNCVWVDSLERVHLELRYTNQTWYCAGLEMLEPLGYGRYLWYVDSPVDLLGTSVVGGMFIYAVEEVWGTNQNELDIEFTHAWTESAVTSVTYTVQPYTIPGNAQSFYMVLTNSPSTHEIEWRPDRVRFRSWFGHSTSPPPGSVIADWFFVTRGIPVEECGARPMMNLWLYEGRRPSSTTAHVEMVVSDFFFEPFRGFLLADDFTDSATSELWQVIRGSPPADVHEEGGALHITPVSYGPVVGYGSVYTYRRNERGARYVQKGVLRQVSVSSGVDGDDIFVLQSLSVETNDALRAPAASVLKAGYDAGSDELTLYLFTKTNSPMSEGTLIFQGSITNFSTVLAQEPVELRLEMEPSNYWVRARRAESGQWLAITAEVGSASGALNLGEALTNCYAFWGAQCNSSAAGSVVWDAVALGVSSQQWEEFRVNLSPVSADEFELSWPGAFDGCHRVELADAVEGPYVVVYTNLPALDSEVSCSITSSASRGFLRVVTYPIPGLD